MGVGWGPTMNMRKAVYRRHGTPTCDGAIAPMDEGGAIGC